MELFSSANSLVRARAPASPVTCLRPHAAVRAARYFKRNFPGEILYALKSNPRSEILNAIHDAGIKHFDVASIAETKLAAERFPSVRLSYMHPVKSREAIGQAYFDYGVRDFALDSFDELAKITAATEGARDLTLLIRLAVPNDHAELDLSAKFGIGPAHAKDLLVQTRAISARVGVCFHVGSQCMDPSAFGLALDRVGDLIRSSGVMLDIVDIGGGFPSLYADMTPPPLDAYMGEISTALERIPIGNGCEIWAEPGRALVAEAASTVVRVDHRRDDHLYINDGTYGSLFDAGVPGFVYPARAIRPPGRPHGWPSRALAPFSFYGPTCDGLDYMKGPFMLPEDMREGDYIEIGQTGAYGCTMRTRFNGFYSDETAILRDQPMLSLYRRPTRPHRPASAALYYDKSGTDQ
ncbi:MAG: type III PLP-dependent enzyme [Alphaproteobacteria bacterium]|nr:type III PLP-dependent enzyme [Alphaproteobacteria bacterium]